MIALSILSVLFLGITDLLLAGRRSSMLSHQRFVGSQYADNVLTALDAKDCDEFTPLAGLETSPDVLGLAYTPTDEEKQLTMTVSIDREMDRLYAVSLAVKNPVGQTLAERKALLSCDD